MRARNMQALTSDVKARFPGVVIYGKGDRPHELRVSDHNEDDTAGVRAAQSDSDSVPEHRAIDVMLGPAISEAQLQALIDEILASPRLRARLKYINFKNWQWSRSRNWVRADNSDDPHPTHAHFSGDAANDEDDSGWLEKIDMYCRKGDVNGQVGSLQRHINEVLEFEGVPEAERLAIDYDYGPKTAAALLRVRCGNPANNGEIYWVGEYDCLNRRLREIAATRAVAAHLADSDHSGGSGGLTPHTHAVPGLAVSVSGSGSTGAAVTGEAVAT